MSVASAVIPSSTRPHCGVVAIDKPTGMTSFDAVRVVRRVFGERRVGHAGTLDPTASGLLPICVGQATRLVDYFHLQPKTYRCVVRLGERSDTLDTEGTIVPGGSAANLREEDVRALLPRFIGEVEQVPPMHSAVRHEGRHLYELARTGQHVERRPRRVHIDSITIDGFRGGERAEVDLTVVSGKGAYMRVLAADMGEFLGVGALLAWLSRTSYGPLCLADARTPEELLALPDPRAALLPPDTAVSYLPRVDLPPQQATMLRRGQAVWLPRLTAPPDGLCRVHAADGSMVALAECSGALLRPTKVMA